MIGPMTGPTVVHYFSESIGQGVSNEASYTNEDSNSPTTIDCIIKDICIQSSNYGDWYRSESAIKEAKDQESRPTGRQRARHHEDRKPRE